MNTKVNFSVTLEASPVRSRYAFTVREPGVPVNRTSLDILAIRYAERAPNAQIM